MENKPIDSMSTKAENPMDKRKSKRVKFNFDVYYPHVNNKWESENNGLEGPVIETVNISDSGICFISKVSLSVGDFVSFLIRIGENPSFPCLGEVKWIEPKDNNFLVGCQFYTLNSNQVEIIREYIEKH